MKNSFFLFVLTLFSIQISQAQAPVITNIQGQNYSCSQPASPTTYSVFATNNPTQYIWSVFPSAGVIIVGQGSSAVNISFPNTNLMYTVFCYASNASGNSPIVSQNVQVYETPTVTFSGLSQVCQGSQTFLMASPTLISSSSTLQFSWTPSAGIPLPTLPLIFPSLNSTTTYTLLLNLGMCSNTALYTVSVNPTPTLTASSNYTSICSGNSSTLTLKGGADPYFLNTVYVSSLTVIQPTTTTSYTITSMNEFGCFGQVIFTQKVSTCVGIQSYEEAAYRPMIFPNPNNGAFVLRSEVTENAALVNELGQVVRDLILEKNEDINITGLSPGFYYLVTPTASIKIVVFN